MINAFLKKPWWQQIIFIVAICICYIQLAGAIGTKVLVPLIGWSGGADVTGDLTTADSVEGRFVRWDSGYYLRIAKYGYRPNGTEIAFFPLYPIAIHLVSQLTELPLLWSGLLLSIFCFLCACLYLYKLVLVDYRQEVAIWSVLWLCCFPMAFFFTAIYAEALFLMFCIASAYYARRGQFIASGIAIALAGATRPTAFLLAILFFFEFWQQRNFKQGQFIRLGLGTLIAPLGLLGFSLFLSTISGDMNTFGIYVSNQSAEWNRSITWPWITFYDSIVAVVFGKGINSDWFSRALVLQDFFYAVLGIIGAAYGLYRLRLSIALFFLTSMIFMYANHGPYGYAFWSMPRYVASLFPIYLILALIATKLPKSWRYWLLLVSIGQLGILSAWFASGRWVA